MVNGIFEHTYSKQGRKDMENTEQEMAERLETANASLERTQSRLEERIAAATALSGDVDRITATVEAVAATRREAELAEKLAAAERELAEVKAAAAQSVLNPLRRTVPAATTEMLAKHGIGEGPVDVRTLDAALAGLSLEQRIAVKSQLLRAGAVG
jgi:septal ring factor EnvC (AmiA/AmiB activator)